MSNPQDCLFCKIASRKIPSDIALETPQVVVFGDINPQAPIHVRVAPKDHLVINSRRDGGQTVDHLRMRVLGGRHMNWLPG